jgi:hypothetical protein
LNVELRSAEETVRAARARENLANAEADAARQARENAERLVGPAKRSAQQEATAVGNGATERLDRLQEQLDRVTVRAKDAPRPEPSMRLRARVFLHGGGETVTDDDPRNPASTLMSITTLDPIAAGFYEVSRLAGQAMQYVFDNGGSEDLAARADSLECRGWASLMNRIKQMAGEAS